MRSLPLLLTLVVGVALWAAPSQAQVADFFQRYTSAIGCSGPSQAHHHINQVTPSGAGTVYETDVLDVSQCNYVTICSATAETAGANPEFFIQRVLTAAGARPTDVLADINGDGVINATDQVALDGDDGADSDGDGTAQQSGCMYDITGLNLIRLDITDTDGDAAGDAADTYVEVSCR
jgi:hypothetical protein